MIFVARVLFNGHHDGVGAHKPGYIVDMAVRVVTHASFTEPDRAGCAKPVGEDALVVDARHSRIADLDVAEQPFFRDEDEPLAVDLDATTFEHDPLARGAARFQALESGDA